MPKCWLRIEDHDRQRCRPEFETALLEDLEWLGLRPTQEALASHRAGRSLFRQSDNDAVYQAHVTLLRARAPRLCLRLQPAGPCRGR